MKHKVQKGTCGYIEKQRKNTLIRTIIFFAISLAVYLTGYFSTGSNQNLLTIVAVLGCLPACKSAVNTIMFFRYRGCPKEAAQKLRGHGEGCQVLWDMVFTSYEKTFEINHMALSGNVLTGYASNPACDCSACEKHLRAMLAQNGITGVTVKIFSELPKYINRLDQLSKLEREAEEGDQEERIVALLYAISL